MSESRALSYHDVRVFCDGVEHRIDRDYSLELMCTKVAGWRLFQRSTKYGGGEHHELLGGEFDGEPFRIEVRSVVIVDSTSRAEDDEDDEGAPRPEPEARP